MNNGISIQNITYSFDGTNATGSYGDATAKAHADTLYCTRRRQMEKVLEDDVKREGLKTKLIRNS